MTTKKTDLEITTDQFNHLVKIGAKIYLTKDPDLQAYLNEVKIKVKEQNKGLKPYLGTSCQGFLKCRTCNNVAKAHPETGYCFVCGTDNWN